MAMFASRLFKAYSKGEIFLNQTGKIVFPVLGFYKRKCFKTICLWLYTNFLEL
jgi:hypothetical protein